MLRGVLNVTADEASNLDAVQCYTYGTSEGLFAGAGMHATWVGCADERTRRIPVDSLLYVHSV